MTNINDIMETIRMISEEMDLKLYCSFFKPREVSLDFARAFFRDSV